MIELGILIILLTCIFLFTLSNKGNYYDKQRLHNYHDIDNEEKNSDQHVTHKKEHEETVQNKCLTITELNVELLVGKTVFHKTFGEGYVKRVYEKKYIEVYFEDIQSSKKFVFPDAFSEHLKLKDEQIKYIIVSKKAKPSVLPPVEKSKPKPIPVPKQKKLIYLKQYGTNSKKIYLNCCNWFGWDKSQSFNFGGQGKLLYAKEGSPEKYSPWFIAHSNLTDTTAKKWRNKIEGNFIFEEWKSPTSEMNNDKTVRIVFAKKKDGWYYFYGVYRVRGVEMKYIDNSYTYIKTYERIAENYPNP